MLEAEGKTISGGLNPVCGGFGREQSIIVYKRLLISSAIKPLPSALQGRAGQIGLTKHPL